MKKVLSLLLVALMLIGMLPMTAPHAHAAVTDGDTVKYTLSGSGTQYAVGEVHKLDDAITVTTTQCHFTSDLRIYSSSEHNGFAIIECTASGFKISKILVNAGNKVDKISVAGSDDGSTWVDAGSISVTATSYKDYTLSLSTPYKFLKLDVAGSNQVRLKYMSITFKQDANACQHTNTTTNTVPATCTEPGSETVVCNDCDETVSSSVINALGHSFVDGVCANEGCGETQAVVSFSVPSQLTAPTNEYADGNGNVTLPTLDATYVGKYTYTFVGWTDAKSDDDSKPTNLYAAGATYTATENTTLYAVYSYIVPGVSVNAGYVKKDITAIESGASVVIVATKAGATYAMSNDKGTSSGPLPVAVTIADDKLSAEPADNIKWTIEKSGEGFVFHPNGDTTKWLYCTNSNNGVRVGDNTNKLFVIDNGYLKNVATSRYLGVYNTQDWRCYTTNTGTSNIANQTFAFYVESDGAAVSYVYALEDLDVSCTHESTTETVVDASCTEDGSKTVICDGCGAVISTEVLAATGHTEETVTNPATCTEAGSTDVVCSVCKATLSSTPIPATGHNYVDGVCSCGKEYVSYAGNYFIAARREDDGNYFYMTSTLESDKRYAIVDSGLTTLPASVTGVQGKVFTFVENEDGTYSIYVSKMDADAKYLGWKSDNTGILVTEAEALKLTIDALEDGTVNITFNDGTNVRYLALNSDSRYNYYAFYKAGQKQNLSLVPVDPSWESEIDTTDPTTEPSSEPVSSEDESSEPEASEPGSEPETVETEATISFATTDQRVTLTNDVQVWSNDGLTVTNNKSKSTSNVADYAKPARFYKSSNLVFEFKAMHTIIVDCNSNDYAAALKNSITNATVTVSNDIVTIALATPADTFTIEVLSAQIRVDSITVKGTSSCAHVWDAGVETVPVGCTTSGTVIYTCTKCGETKTDNIPAIGHNYTVTDGELLCGNCNTSPEYTDIAVAQNYKSDKDVYYLKGIATHISGQNIYIEDATGGICVRFNSTGDAEGIALGDQIVVWDTLSKYNGLIQTSYTLASEYVKLSSGNELPSKVVTIADLNADTTNEYLGERVVIENVTIGIISPSGNTPVTDADGNSINIRALTGIAENVTQGDTVTITAIVSTYNGYQLIVNPGTAATDVVVTKEAGEVVRETVTIAEAKNGTTAESYQVEGVVTFIDSSNYYIQDATGAIIIRVSGASLKIGDKIVAYGAYALYNGLIELECDVANVEVVSSDVVVDAAPVTLAALMADEANEYLAEKVWIENLCVTKVGTFSEQYGNVDYTLTDGNGNTIKIYRAPVDGGADDCLSVGTILNVEAIVSSYNGYQLRIVSADSIECIDSCKHNNTTTNTVPATLGKAGSKTVTCDLCGVVTETIELAPLAAVDSWGLTLDDSIQVNFKVVVDASVKAQAGARIVISVGEGEFKETVTYSLSDNEASDTEYLVSTNMGAAQMGDTITVKVLTDADEGIEKTYSIKSYAETILADQNYAEYHDVVKAMLTYGAAAQTYFGYKTEAMVPSYECAVEVPESADYAIGTDGSIEGIEFYGATMIFREKIAVRYYFTGDATKVTTMEGLQIVAVDENKFYVEVSHAIADLDTYGYAVLYSVENEESMLWVDYSAMNYVVRMNQNGSDNLKALLKALYNYHTVAAALVESNSAE